MPTPRPIRALIPEIFPRQKFCISSYLPVGLWLLLILLVPLAGCSRFKPQSHEYVYVAARQVYLHDRVAAVSNRVALVTNGEALEVVEHGKRFTKVKTPKGEIGWLEDHAVIDGKLYAQFDALSKEHAQDPIGAQGQLRDDLYLHVAPGRETPHFLLVTANSKVQLLERGTIPKAVVPGAPTAPIPAATAGSKPGANLKAAQKGMPTAQPNPAPTVPMEDWWLVRDSGGHTGWLLANRVDVDVPDEVGQYAEGQRMVAAYPIAKVMDDGTGGERRKAKADKKGAKPEQPQQPQDTGVSPEHTVYVTVLSPPRGGLPFDFDQIRVFTWSLNHHRYETGYRLHGVQGYLPVTIGQETVNGVVEPTFTFQIASRPDVKIDPETGVTRPVAPRTLSFRLEGNLVKRTGSDLAPIILTHEVGESAKAKSAAAKKKH